MHTIVRVVVVAAAVFVAQTPLALYLSLADFHRIFNFFRFMPTICDK